MDRTCWCCKETFPLTEEFWYKDRRNSEGFQKKCKKCNKEFNKKYRECHPDYFKEKDTIYYEEKKMNNMNFNSDRYNKYRINYLKRRKNALSTVEGRLHSTMFAAKSRAKSRNIPFDLDKEFLIELLHKQNNCCKLTGIPFTAFDRNETFFNPFNPSIDRIDSTKGYTKDNVQIICTAMNLALNQFGEDTFALLAKSYLEKNK